MLKIMPPAAQKFKKFSAVTKKHQNFASDDNGKKCRKILPSALELKTLSPAV
jgi:hypothetical protein